MAGADTPGDDGKPGKGGSSVKDAVVELLIATVIAGALGGGFAFVVLSPTRSPSGSAEATAVKGLETASLGLGANLVDLPPIVTNIGSPSQVWVRVESSIVIEGKATEHSDILAAQIASDELAYLRTLSIAQLEGPVGLENVRQDLTDRAVTRSGGKVRELILKTLVLQ